MFTLDRRGARISLWGPEGIYSVYDPRRVFTGMGWDAEAASALLVDGEPRIALLLGYGGGTVARQLRTMFPDLSLEGVEIDASIIRAARRHFSLKTIATRVLHDDGAEFLRRSRAHYDFILDDMWDHRQFKARAIVADSKWPAVLKDHLTAEGVAAVNVFARRESPQDFDRVVRCMKSAFASVQQVWLPGSRVCVVAGSLRRVPAVVRRRVLGALRHDARKHLDRVEFAKC